MESIAKPKDDNHVLLSPDATTIQSSLNKLLLSLITGDRRCLQMCLGSAFDYTSLSNKQIRIDELTCAGVG